MRRRERLRRNMVRNPKDIQVFLEIITSSRLVTRSSTIIWCFFPNIIQIWWMDPINVAVCQSEKIISVTISMININYFNNHLRSYKASTGRNIFGPKNCSDSEPKASSVRALRGLFRIGCPIRRKSCFRSRSTKLMSFTVWAMTIIDCPTRLRRVWLARIESWQRSIIKLRISREEPFCSDR